MLWIVLTLLFAQSVQAEVYLCPTDGDGSDTNPYRSRAISELLDGRGNVDLRDDVTKPGLMLCESDSLPNDTTGIVVIGADRSATIRAGAKADIARDAGKVIRGNTVEDAIKELVIPRLPSPKAGKDYEIILSPSRPMVKEVASLSSDLYYKGLAAVVKERGALVADAVLDGLVSVAHALTLTTETFDCADSGSLTCVHTWVDKSGTAINIVSNQAVGVDSATNSVYAQAAVSTADHEVSAITVTATLGGGGISMACSVIGRTTNDAADTYYRTAAVITSSAGRSVSLIRTVTGSSTTLASDGTDWVDGDRLAVRMVGTTISSRSNDVQILSVTDATITTGLYGGLRYAADSAGSNCTWDSWQARDIGAARRKVTPWFN